MNQESDLFVVAVLAVIIKEGRFLALKRSLKKKVAPGLWEILSGRLQHGEDPREGLIREIAEESSVNVELDLTPFDVYVTKYGDQPMLAMLYKAHYISGEVRLSDEHESYEWVDQKTFAQKSPLKKLVQSIQKLKL